jgi:hypothetical protein
MLGVGIRNVRNGLEASDKGDKQASAQKGGRGEMTSGGHTMTEGWNLQLQGRVRDLEMDLAWAEKHLNKLTQYGVMRPSPAEFALARGFLKKMADKRARAVAQAKGIDAFLEQVADVAAEEQGEAVIGVANTPLPAPDAGWREEALDGYGMNGLRSMKAGLQKERRRLMARYASLERQGHPSLRSQGVILDINKRFLEIIERALSPLPAPPVGGSSLA